MQTFPGRETASYPESAVRGFHGLHRFVIFRDIFERAYTHAVNPCAHTVNRYHAVNQCSLPASQLVTLLQAHYSAQHDFFLGHDMDLALKVVENLPKVASGKDLALFVGDNWGVDSRQQMSSLRISMNAAGSQVIVPDPSQLKGGAGSQVIVPDPSQRQGVESLAIAAPNVVFVFGHKDAALRTFVKALATAGKLKGKSLVLFSCYDTIDGESDEDFQSQLVRTAQVDGVLFCQRAESSGGFRCGQLLSSSAGGAAYPKGISVLQFLRQVIVSFQASPEGKRREGLKMHPVVQVSSLEFEARRYGHGIMSVVDESIEVEPKDSDAFFSTDAHTERPHTERVRRALIQDGSAFELVYGR